MRYSKRFQLVVGLAFVAALASAAAWAETRTWTDSTGKFKIEAEMVEAGDDYVVLKKADGSTKKVPLDKLSAEDQKYVADQADASFGESPLEEPAESSTESAEPAEETDADAASSTAGDPKADAVAARKVVTEFFDYLRKEDRTPIEVTLTKAAQEKMSSGDSPVLTLPKPDSNSARVGKATIEGDSATVTVKFKYERRSYDAKISLSREGEGWKIRAMAFTPVGDTEQSIDFETGESTAPAPATVAGGPTRGDGKGPRGLSLGGGGRSFGVTGSPPTPEETDPTATEEMPAEESETTASDDPQELLKSIEALRSDPQFLRNPQAMTTAADTAEKVLGLADATKPQKAAAAKILLELLPRMSQMGAPNLSGKVEALAAQVQELGLDELARPVEALSIQMELLASRNPRALTESLAKVETFLSAGSIGPQEAGLANVAASMVERYMQGAEASAAIQKLADMLATSSNPQIAQFGEQMMGKARRLGLIGNPMEIHGVTWDGKPLDLSQFEGKVVLVDFWATWCGPCIAEMPNIRANYDKYHEQGFDVIAISIDNDLNALNKYVESQQPPWTIVADRHKKTPASKQLAAYYGVNAIPCTILIGRDGNVVALNVRGERLGKELEKLMGGG